MSAERAEWVLRIAAGALLSADQKLRAGEALLASDVIAEVECAQRLLLAAMATQREARALAAAAYDRLRLLRGEPQKFGTQIVTRNGEPQLWTVDPTTTDSERAKWDLPSLAALEQRAHEPS